MQRDEFNGVLKEMNIKLTKKQVSELYFVLDRDGDGEIDTKELLRGLTDTKRATQINWIRFEEAEKEILNEYNYYHGGNYDSERWSASSNGTDRTDETTPNNTEHTELYRMLLHARAEFDLSYPDLSKSTIHPRAAARISNGADGTSNNNDNSNRDDDRGGNRGNGGGDRGLSGRGERRRRRHGRREEDNESLYSDYSDNNLLRYDDDDIHTHDSSYDEDRYNSYDDDESLLSDSYYNSDSDDSRERILM